LTRKLSPLCVFFSCAASQFEIQILPDEDCWDSTLASTWQNRWSQCKCNVQTGDLNTSNVDQTGDDNDSTVEQIGTSNVSDVDQVGEQQFIWLPKNGIGNMSTAAQEDDMTSCVSSGTGDMNTVK
jgi:hypothetical protein